MDGTAVGGLDWGGYSGSPLLTQLETSILAVASSWLSDAFKNRKVGRLAGKAAQRMSHLDCVMTTARSRPGAGGSLMEGNSTNVIGA